MRYQQGMTKAAHLRLGKAGEDAAARFLAARGWRILDRNWRPPGRAARLELDIVAMHGDCLVFVEVRARTRAQVDFSAYMAFPPRKQAKLARAAGHYLSGKNLWRLPCRFDLVYVERGPDGTLLLEHHPDVIEFGRLVDSGHAPWQPW
jgi:putative endonuclease